MEETHLSADGQRMDECAICGELTTINVQATQEIMVYVCHDCLEKAKTHFIWLCMNCGKVHIRAKDVVIKRMTDNKTMREAYMACRDLQIIQGLTHCVECVPDNYLMYHRSGKYGLINSSGEGMTH